MTMKRIFITPILIFAMFKLFGQENKVDKDFEKISSIIYPVIKVQVTETNERQEISMTGENVPIYKKLVGDLMCFYGIDRETYFELITKKQLPKEITVEILDSIARENLLNATEGKIQIHKTDFNGYGLTCGGEYEAALMTLPEIWSIINEKLGENVVFAAPSKDLIMFVSADSKENIESLRKVIEEVQTSGAKLLSKLTFIYSRGKIEIYK
jgi:uncharacterized protein YtpQ (UPF0354 family)